MRADVILSAYRDVFYENVWLYGTQSTLDRAAEDLSRLLGVPRRGLHLTATGKGLVAGSLAYTTHDGTTIDVSQAQQGTSANKQHQKCRCELLLHASRRPLHVLIAEATEAAPVITASSLPFPSQW